MPSYELSPYAENDLLEVARYTLRKWGKNELQIYRNGLNDAFEAIAAGSVQKRNFVKDISRLLVTKYRYHYIFYVTENREKPYIIGVIHDR